jgi:hypothetical protein
MPQRPYGSSTLSTTWITPFFWKTSTCVTVDMPPLASARTTLPPWALAISVSPAMV